MSGQSFCSRCGALIGAGARFCPSCGAPLGQQAPAGAPGAVPGWNPTAPGRSRGCSCLGCGLVAVLVVVVMFAVLAALGSLKWSASAPTTTGPAPSTSRPFVQVTYRLSGSAKSASITFTDPSGNIQQVTAVPVPLVMKDGTDGLTMPAKHGAFVTILAQNLGDSGTLECQIYADGVEINRGISAGGYAIVTCSATIP